MLPSKNAIEMEELMDQAEKILESDKNFPASDLTDFGPVKKIKDPNTYTREEIVNMLDQFKSMLTHPKASWNYSQNYLNIVGKIMRTFLKIRNGNPDYRS